MMLWYEIFLSLFAAHASFRKPLERCWGNIMQTDPAQGKFF